MLLEGEIIAARSCEAQRLGAEAAAAQGVAPSMTRLGMLYPQCARRRARRGSGAGWWRKAAMLGDADGQAMLGAALHLGAGVTRDPLAALAWLMRARERRQHARRRLPRRGARRAVAASRPRRPSGARPNRCAETAP